MKHQVVFSLKDKSKKIKCPRLKFLFGTLRVNKDMFCNYRNVPWNSSSLSEMTVLSPGGAYSVETISLVIGKKVCSLFYYGLILKSL